MLLGIENQTTNKKVLQCPTCQEKGIIQNLCVVDGENILVMRRQKDNLDSRLEMTVIKSKQFEVYCGRCRELVYKKV